MSAPHVLAVDGGASKTDLALVAADGALLSLVARPAELAALPRLRRMRSTCSESCSTSLERGRPVSVDGPVTDVAQLLMAGVDFPVGGARAARRVRRARLGRSERSSTTTRSRSCAPEPRTAGASRSCAAPGSTASASRRTGGTPASPRSGRSPATGVAATTSASRRSRRQRAAKTGAARAPRSSAWFRPTSDSPTPSELAEEIHRDRIAATATGELPPVVFTEAAGDGVAAGIVERLADEVVAMARVALERLDLESASPWRSCSEAAC